MAQETAVTNVRFEHWLKKAVEWGQVTTAESQQDVCLHLPELQAFLLQIYEVLQNMNTTAVIQSFPLIGQLLGRLCWNPFVVAHDKSQKILLQSLCCLYSKEPQNAVEFKANDWIRGLLCHLISLSDMEDIGVHPSVSTLTTTPVDYLSSLVTNMVSSLVGELQGGVHESNMPLRRRISLSEKAVTSLWLRHLPSLEKATLHLIEKLLTCETMQMKEVMKNSFLPQASVHHPAIFLVIDNIFRKMLLDTDGNVKALTAVQVFTRHFIQIYQQNTQQHQIPLKTYFPHVHQSLVMVLAKQPSDIPPKAWPHHLKYIADMLKTMTEEGNLWSNGGLLENWFFLAHFGDWLHIAAYQLLTSENKISDALLWLLAFYHHPNTGFQHRMQEMAELRCVVGHLKELLSQTPSKADLQAALDSSKAIIQHFCLKNVINQLFVSFLIFSSRGHKLAHQFFACMDLTWDAKHISALLTNAEYWMNLPGFQNQEAQRTVEVLQELFQGR
ncbi:Fanconi anemia group C protein isoform X2 [Protopterus annectens]|uniref:Fanconi anemia group C protein isoform X2 n=1 Tax=Protopterus annectens TaxID=7888 RepID=UPI001CFA1012|nr:Fanconi anemia group C protein isoform X2 [Protopterus annectens]